MARRGGAGEDAVSKAIGELLTLYFGPIHYRLNSGMLLDRNGRPVPFLTTPDGKPARGVSDRMVFATPPLGRCLAVEVKRPAIPALGQRAGQPSADQVAFLESIRAAGGVAVCVDGTAALQAVLDRLRADPAARFRIDGTPEEDPAP